MINVTKTFLPSFEEYTTLLKRVWDKAWITNNGECVVELEKKLKEYLRVQNLWYCNNGTVVLQFAIKALELEGEIITTPFSYVATTSAILWENCTPVFADIESSSLTIDPGQIEKLITNKTTAILATHVYGSPCDVEAIAVIAAKHRLKVIYDAAHCFGVSYKGESICNYGDLSTLSFHATKLFHTVEGGAIITQSQELAKKVFLMRQFGHINDDHFTLGINGKASEFHAAMGLCVLPYMDSIIAARKQVSEWYDAKLNLSIIKRPIVRPGTAYNYAYYPVILQSQDQLLRIVEALKEEQISARRYFYPSLNTLDYLKGTNSCPVSEDISVRVLSLPLYPELDKADVERISHIINNNL